MRSGVGMRDRRTEHEIWLPGDSYLLCQLFARVERRKMAERTIFLHSDVCRSRPGTFLEPAAGKVQKEYRAVTAS